jgi:glycosyltransferase involved in cell wall biosynthesis
MKIAVIYPSVSMGRPLNVSTLLTDTRGLTGSEGTAVGYAVGLASRGHEVTLFTNVTAAQSYKGVAFLHDSHWEPEQADAFDAVISFMNAAPLINCNPKPFRIFNMQCGDFGGQPVGWEDHVDLLCALSHKHAEVMRPTTALPAEKWRVMANGVDTDAFKPGTKIPGRCIWASSHDRGLHHVLEAWPEVRAAVPHAELHVFYDINGLERFAKMGPTDVPFLAELQRRSVYEIEMMRRLKNHGVFLGGSVSRERMQAEMAQAEVLAYPSDSVRYCETFGCTVLEAMSAGCVPVLCFADSFSELWESRGCPGVAWPYEPRRDEYVARLINAVRHPQKWATDLRASAHDFAWPGLVEKLERCLVTRGADGLDRPSFSEEAPVEYVKYVPFHDRFAIAS